MTGQSARKRLPQIAVAGALGLGLVFAGSLANAGEGRGLGRGPATFGSSLDTSGASGFTPDRRLGDAPRSSPGAQLGDTRAQPDRPVEGEIMGSKPRGLNFDDNRRFETGAGTDEGLTSRGRDHRGAPSNGRSPFNPNRLGGR